MTPADKLDLRRHNAWRQMISIDITGKARFRKPDGGTLAITVPDDSEQSVQKALDFYVSAFPRFVTPLGEL